MRLVGWDEDFVGIVLSESRKIDQQAVLVGHGESNLVDLGNFFERALGHCVERLLDGFAVVVGEGAEHRLAKSSRECSQREDRARV